MNKNLTIIWFSVIILFVLPTPIGRLFIDMAGGIMILLFLISIIIAGIGWFSWKSLKSNLINCKKCGATYISASENCPICGASNNSEKQETNFNIPASSATIDIEAKETD